MTSMNCSRLSKDVNFISVPVTVKDPDGKMVDGLLAQDFSVYEDNVKQTITFFTSDPFPLSAAVVIDLGISETTLKKVAATYSALDGSFGPFDKVAVFTYGNSVHKQADFGNPQRLAAGVAAHPRPAGPESGRAGRGWSFRFRADQQRQAGRSGAPLPLQTGTRESHVLNDAILMAAGELAHQPRENRKIIFVISNGYEYGSRASYAQVLKVLLTNGIAIYAVGVEAAAIPGMSKLDKLHIPGPGLHRHSSQVRQRHRRRRDRLLLARGDRKRLPDDHRAGAQPVHAGLHHSAEAIEHLSRYRSAGEAAGLAGHGQARILPAATATRNAGGSACHSSGSTPSAAAAT